MKGVMFALLAAALFAGCATVNTHEISENKKIVEVSNTCWRFFMLPVASGDSDDPNGWGCNWFCNEATVANQMKMLDAEAKNQKARSIYDVSTLTTDEDCLLILFVRENIHTTATVICE